MAALGSVNQPRPGDAKPPQARAERARRAAVMQELEQKAAFPPYFRVVVAGVARLIEFALLAVSGFAVAADVFSAHGGANILQLLEIQVGAFVACSLFQMLRCYTIRALRHPLLPTVKDLGRAGRAVHAHVRRGVDCGLRSADNPHLAVGGVLLRDICRHVGTLGVLFCRRASGARRQAGAAGGRGRRRQRARRPVAARARARPTDRKSRSSGCSTTARTTVRLARSKARRSSAMSTTSSILRAARASIWSSSRCRSPRKSVCWKYCASCGCCRSTCAWRPTARACACGRAPTPTSAPRRCSTCSTSRSAIGTSSSRACSTAWSARSRSSCCRRSCSSRRWR